MQVVLSRLLAASGSVGGIAALVAVVAMTSTARSDELPAGLALPPEERATLTRIVQQAGANGVPTPILVDKVREGLAKRVPPARLVVVVETLADTFRRAGTLVSANLDSTTATERAPLQRAVVEALATSLTALQLASIMRTAGKPELATQAIGTLTDLVTRGYPTAPATSSVLFVVRTEPKGLDVLIEDVERARARGASVLGALDQGAKDATRGSEGRGNGRALGKPAQRGNPETDDPGKGPPEGKGPDRETTGGRANSNAGGKGKGNGKP